MNTSVIFRQCLIIAATGTMAVRTWLEAETSGSALQREFVRDLKKSGLPAPVLEYKFMDDRRFRFDLAWPEIKIAIEVDGGQWVKGTTRTGKTYSHGHQSGAGYEAGRDKDNLAQLAGWIVLRFTTRHVTSKKGARFAEMAILKRAMEQGKDFAD